MEITAQNAAQEPTLDQVLGTFENFMQTIIQGVIDASPEDETKLLAEATAETLQLQLQKVHGFVRENHARLSPIQQEEMRKFLQTQDGHNMARRGAETARAIFKKGGFGKKFLQWIIKWFKELKKFIKELVQIIFDLFGWSFPTWIDKLLQILDQSFDMFVSLLADVLGIDLKSFAREASWMEVDYLNELAAFEKLRQAQRTRTASDEG